MVLRVVAPPHRAPFIFFNNSTQQFSGLLYDLLPTLLATAGLPPEYHIFLASDNLATGSYSALASGKADLSLYPAALAESALGKAQLTAAFFNGGLQLLVKKRGGIEGGAFGFLLPFEASLWLCIVCTPFIVYMVWVLAAKVTPLGAFTVRRMRRIDQPHARIKEYAIDSECESFLMEGWYALIGQALIPRGRSWAVWVISLSWGMFGLILLAAYTANLAATLTNTASQPKITSLSDLLKHNGTFAVLEAGYVYEYLQTSTDPVLQLLQQNQVGVPELEVGYEMVRSGAVDALMTFNGFLLPFMAKAPCDTQVVGDVFGVGSQCLMLPLGSNLTRSINQALYRLGETGVLDTLAKQWITHSDTCDMDLSELQDAAPQLTLASFQGLWYMVFVFFGICILVALLERFILHIFHKHPELHKRVDRVREKLCGDGSRVFEHGEGHNHGSSSNGLTPHSSSLELTDSKLSVPGNGGAVDERDVEHEHAVLNSLWMPRFF